MSTSKSSRFTFHVSRAVFYVLLLLLPLLAAFPLWGPGMVNTRGGGDSPFLLQRTLDMAEALRYGHIPPRWMAHAAYDLGYPFFNHYAALPFYLSGGLTALGLSPILAIQATQTLGFLLAALTMALWARRVYGNRRAVLLAVAAYTFAPFHLVNVYVRGDSLSEFWAFVWYPLILWTLARAAERSTLRRIVLAALSYAALILTHNVSALIFAPFALLYAASQREGEKAKKRESELANHASRFTHHVSRIAHYALRIMAPFLLAFLLTAWFWIPAIGETGYGQMGPEFTAGYFHYSNHFRGLNLVQPTFFFNYDIAPAVGEAGPFAMGLVQAVLTLLGAGILIWRISESAKRRKSEKANQRISESANDVSRITHYALRITHYEYILFSLALSTLMITPLSALLWEHLPLLATTQFPWRFLSVQALFTAIATGALASESASERKGGKARKRESEKADHVSRFTQYAVRSTHYALPAMLIFFLALAALGTLRPERLHITAKDVTWDNLLLYEAFTGNIGTTIRYEYLPRDVKPRLYISEAVVDGVDAAQPIADGDAALTATLLTRAPQRQVWRVMLDGAAPVVFPLHWWPGWQAEVDGTAAAAYPMTGSGRLTVDLAAGEHEVTLRLRNTPLRAAAEAISAMTVLVLGVAVFQRKGAKAQRRRDFLVLAGSSITVCMLSVLFPAIYSLRVVPSPELHAFDFIHAPYPHHEPVRFGPLLLEEVYATSGASRNALNIVAAPGEQIGLGLRWQLSDTTPLTGTLRLVSPAEPRHGVAYGMAETTFTVPAMGMAGYSLTLPPDLSRGLYLLELRFYDAAGELYPQTPQGVGRGTLYVGAVRVRSTPVRRLDAPVVAQLGELTLHSATPLSSSPDTLRLQLAWSLARRTPRNWSLSLRLLDAEGRQLSQVDLQPGYGYLPTSLWRAGEFITDYPVLPVPEGLAPGDYTLRVIAYLEATMQAGGEADVPIRLMGATVRDPRDPCCEWQRRETQTLCAADGISLTGLALPEAHPEGAPLDFTAEWSATEQPAADLTARWEAVDAAGNVIAAREGPLAPGSRTGDWPRFAWVRAPVTLPLPPLLPDGPYTLRLTLLAGDVIHPTCELGALDIAPRARSFAWPTLPFPQQADFGAELRLLGYEITRSGDVLTLTLWWQAQTAPGRDYKRFVHLLAPSGEIVAQDDAMPRAWTYPTSWWAAGEVVSETVTLPAPPGEYRLGVGWYDGETGIPLPATDAAGTPWPDNRVMLSEPMTSR